MNINYYNEFLNCQSSGLKKKATESIRDFISSFENEEDIKNWVWENINDLNSNPSSRIRHEIFHELIYPILKLGYLRDDFHSTLWLGKLIQNIYQTPKIHKELDWISGLELLRKAYTLKPKNDEARLLLLQCLVEWLHYSEHEWPSGILYGNDGATLEQCREISQEVELIIRLDKEHQHRELIKQYTEKLTQYRVKISS